MDRWVSINEGRSLFGSFNLTCISSPNSIVNEVVGSGDWEESSSLGETWRSRNTYSYGRQEGGGGTKGGTSRPEVLDKLLSTTDRVVQEIDSVEYGLSDIQEYYANSE